MKYHLIGRWERRPEILRAAKALEAMKHEITSRWLNYTGTTGGEYMNIRSGKWPEFSVEGLADVDAADTVLVFGDAPMGYIRQDGQRGTHLTQLGYALAKGKRIVVVGSPENVHMAGTDAVTVYRNFAAYEADLNAEAAVTPLATVPASNLVKAPKGK